MRRNFRRGIVVCLHPRFARERFNIGRIFAPVGLHGRVGLLQLFPADVDIVGHYIPPFGPAFRRTPDRPPRGRVI